MGIFSFVEQMHYVTFLVLVIGIIGLPGIDMAYVLSNTLAGGRTLGIAAITGIVTGGVIHSIMAFLGIGVALQAIPWAYSAISVIGAVYLGWIGTQILCSTDHMVETKTTVNPTHFGAVLKGVFTSLLNPKAYFFMFAVFPQYIRPDQGSVLIQIAILSAIIATAQITIYGVAAVTASNAIENLDANSNMRSMITRAFGFLLIALAVWSGFRAFM